MSGINHPPRPRDASGMDTADECRSPRTKSQAVLSSCSSKSENVWKLLAPHGVELRARAATGYCRRRHLEVLVSFADTLRREAVGETITYVVNRNINFTNVCFVGCSFADLARGRAPPDALLAFCGRRGAQSAEAWERAPRRFASRAAYRADLDGFFYQTFFAPSSARFLPCTCIAFSPWKFLRRRIKRECRCAITCK